MRILKQTDLFQARRLSLIADYDKETIFNLYMPLIGANAAALYMTLLYEAKNQRITKINMHENLLVKMQLSTSEFLKARQMLEAVGLLKTYVHDESEEVQTYHYDLYAPKTPKSFFDNALLYGMLIKYIGEGEAKRLKSLYNDNYKDDEGREVSKTFGETFHPDFEDPAFKLALQGGHSRGRKTAKIDYEFSYERFFEALSTISQIGKESLTKEEMKEIERLSALYGVNEYVAASVTNHLYDPSLEKGQRIDLERLNELLSDESNYRFLTTYRRSTNNSQVSGDTNLAKKINLMETTSPKDFLTVLQGGTPPISSDLRIIDTLSRKFHLSPGVINVIVDYVLSSNNNVLSKAYAEKVAASLLRENVTTVLDAMNYIKNFTTKKRKPKTTNTNTGSVTNINTNQTTNEDIPSWDELMNMIDGGEN